MGDAADRVYWDWVCVASAATRDLTTGMNEIATGKLHGTLAT
jgi:hypothetical protein